MECPHNLVLTRMEPAMLGYTPQTIKNLIRAGGILEIDCRDYTWETVKDMIAIAVALPRLPHPRLIFIIRDYPSRILDELVLLAGRTCAFRLIGK
jgi:hypothetical protein